MSGVVPLAVAYSGLFLRSKAAKEADLTTGEQDDKKGYNCSTSKDEIDDVQGKTKLHIDTLHIFRLMSVRRAFVPNDRVKMRTKMQPTTMQPTIILFS